MQSDFRSWPRIGLLVCGVSLATLIGVSLFEASGARWVWVLAVTLPLGPAVLLADIAGRLIGWQFRGRLLAALTLWPALPASMFASETPSVAAQLAASLLAAFAAGILLMTLVTAALRAATWLLNHRRQRRGLPSLSDAANHRFGLLGPVEQASVLLGALALIVMTTGLGVDTSSAVLPEGPIGSVTLVVVKFWATIQGVAVSVLAGSIVLFVQARGGLNQTEGPQMAWDPTPGGQHQQPGHLQPLDPSPSRSTLSRNGLGQFVAAASIGLLAGIALRRRRG